MPAWTAVAAAFGGGLFGAAIGALPAFALCGLCTLVGVALALAGLPYDFLGEVAFGPVLGPHVAFAGGAAAAAYAALRGELEDGTDVVTPLAALATPDVLLVGGLFGVLGHVGQITLAPLLDDSIDVIALMVFVSNLVARVAFGRSGVLGTAGESGVSRFRPYGEHVWVPYQQAWPQAAVLGLGSGLVAAFMALGILAAVPGAMTAAIVAAFGISAASLLFMSLGAEVPVTHHMTISAAYAAAVTGNLALGVAAGVVAALLGEVISRAFYVCGDTHVDPPAGTIAVMSLIVLLPGALAG